MTEDAAARLRALLARIMERVRRDGPVDVDAADAVRRSREDNA